MRRAMHLDYQAPQPIQPWLAKGAPTSHLFASQSDALLSTALSEPTTHLIGIPPFSVVLAEALAGQTGLPMAVAAIEPIWTRDGSICGAAAFDGTVLLKESLDPRMMSQDEVSRAIEDCFERVVERMEEFGLNTFADLTGCTAVVIAAGVDDRVTTRVAIVAARQAGARRVLVADAKRIQRIKLSTRIAPPSVPSTRS